MAFDPRNVRYPPQNMPPYPYPNHHVIQSMHRMDENRNENQCGNKEIGPPISHQSSGTQTVQKVDAATMTDPLQIDFRLTSEYLERCSTNLGRLSHICQYEDNSKASSTRQDVHPKIEYDLPEPQRINGMLIYHCPECAYRFEDRETLQEHLEDHKQRPYVCDICGAKLRRKEHLDRHYLDRHQLEQKRPYQCSTCYKTYKRNEHLLRHCTIHSGKKTEVCTECGKAFYRRDHLRKHARSHLAKRNKESESFSVNPSQVQTQQQTIPQQEGLSTFRLAGPPPFSIMRT